MQSVLHAGVGGASSLGWDPVDVLTRVLDVACLAVDAVLSVDLQPHGSVFRLHKLVHPCWAVMLLWTSKVSQVPFHWNGIISEGEVGGLVLIVVGACQGYRGQEVKGHLWQGCIALPLKTLLRNLALALRGGEGRGGEGRGEGRGGEGRGGEGRGGEGRRGEGLALTCPSGLG